MTDVRGALPGGLPDDVAQALEELNAAGFVVADKRGTGTVDRVIVCRSHAVAVRVTADRGQWWVEAGPLSESEWFDAEIWAACLRTTEPPQRPSALAQHVRFFVDNHDVLAAGARDFDILTCLLRRRWRRARERLGLPPV